VADGMVTLDETTLKTISGDTHFYYAADIEPLTQADLPWQPPRPGDPVAPSPLHAVIAADTITVRGTLRNPGRDIRIFARRITVEPGALIDVSVADPGFDAGGRLTGQDYPPGRLPEQTDHGAGAAGANGGPGAVLAIEPAEAALPLQRHALTAPRHLRTSRPYARIPMAEIQRHEAASTISTRRVYAFKRPLASSGNCSERR
jgi:hypothetical protein